MIGNVLKSGNPALRVELWARLKEKLPTLPHKTITKDELLICLSQLYTNVEDRNKDVKKDAQEAVFPLMIHLGYVTMAKATEKLKAGSCTVVIAALGKPLPISQKNLSPQK
jgi:cytoskeleton-associated protein 5